MATSRTSLPFNAGLRYGWVIGLVVMAGCLSNHPSVPARWQITVPCAEAEEGGGMVWLRHDGKMAEDGNSYLIQFFAMTNAGDSAGADVTEDLRTNRWPVVRCHIELSVDGGATWPRRIAYGAKVNRDGIGGEIMWSPPEDYGLLSTNAMLRAVRIDGKQWPTRTPSQPYDLPSNACPTSARFSIVGATIDTPTDGSIHWQGSNITMNWRQCGGGSVWDLYWITPRDVGTTPDHWITTISNAVHGANSKVISLNAPVSDQLKLVLISQSAPSIIGYSGTFTVDQ